MKSARPEQEFQKVDGAMGVERRRTGIEKGTGEGSGSGSGAGSGGVKGRGVVRRAGGRELGGYGMRGLESVFDSSEITAKDALFQDGDC